MDYKHSLANYPIKFKGIALSKNRFCLQWEQVEIKLRVYNRDTSDLDFCKGRHYPKIPIGVDGDKINVLAVRNSEETIRVLQEQLIESYYEYMKLFPSHNFKQFINKTRRDFDALWQVIGDVEV